MQSIEISGKSLDEAKKNAAAKLGAAVGDLQVTVLEETKGLFGKSTVKIRAEVASSEAPAAKPKAAKATKATKAAPVVEPEPEPVAEAAEAVAEASVPAPKGRAKKAPKTDAPAKAAVEMDDSTKGEPSEEVASDVIATQEDEERICDIVTKLMASAVLDAAVESSDRQGKYVNVVLDGRDVAHLVGKHGEVLNALQYLVNVIVTQQLHNGVRATIDGGNYRRKREEALTKLATNIANEVKKRGEEAVLDALPAFERRIVHKALATIDGVTTYSEGEEPSRRVVIAPAE